MKLTFTMNIDGSMHKIKGEYTPMVKCGWAPPFPPKFEAVTVKPERALTDKDHRLIFAEANDVYERYVETRERFM